ncbi:hypothetical protein CNYM01_04110 [Colletotrichum nymphaeae SA-01]|uniref:Uncharacterized protein n=1 Tax=Colletotrichum nymphaeae SA-01 TaxID=1460502 RepID=A0A135T3I7_9PEZI|nr:hypothetical protein CNYM01_04110 [Colletotrichum nymphaeae SA-01]
MQLRIFTIRHEHSLVAMMLPRPSGLIRYMLCTRQHWCWAFAEPGAHDSSRLNLKLLYPIPSIQHQSAHPLPVFGFKLKGWLKIQRPVHVTWQTASSGNAPLASPCAPVKATPPVLTIPAFLYISTPYRARSSLRSNGLGSAQVALLCNRHTDSAFADHHIHSNIASTTSWAVPFIAKPSSGRSPIPHHHAGTSTSTHRLPGVQCRSRAYGSEGQSRSATAIPHPWINLDLVVAIPSPSHQPLSDIHVLECFQLDVTLADGG